MSITRKPMKVLRAAHRILTGEVALLLPHPAFRWLYGLLMEWTGHNNGAIEFTQAGHGVKYGVGNPSVYMTAKKQVLESGLVVLTRDGGPGRAAHFQIVSVELQVKLTTWDIVSDPQKLTTPDIVSDQNPAMSGVVSCYVPHSKKKPPYRRSRGRARARCQKNKISRAGADNTNTTAVDAAADLEPVQGKSGTNGSTQHQLHPLGQESVP